MNASPEVTVHQDKVLSVERSAQGFVLQLERGARLHAARLGWGQTPHQGLLASGIAAAPPPEQRLPLLLAFLRLPRTALRREFSVLHIADSASGAYRINNASACAGEHDSDSVRLVVEANPERFAACHGALADDAAVVRALMDDLAGLGVIASGQSPEFTKLLRMAGALPLPTAEGLSAHADQRAQLLARWPGVDLFANSAGPFATSLSDQVIQGLLLANVATGDLPPVASDFASDITLDTRTPACAH